MHEVKTNRMSSERQSGNQGKFGFQPTNEDIVKMEMKLIDFSELEGNDCEVNIADLSGGTGAQLNCMYRYLQEQNIKANAFYNEITQERFTICSEKYPYMNKLNADFFRLKIAHKDNRNLNKRVFSVLRNNPPYVYLNIRGKNIRAEQEFFVKNFLYNIKGGIQIFELPIHQLIGIKHLLSIITSRYSDVFIAKFPQGQFEKFKQVVLVGKAKPAIMQDKQEEEKIRKILESDNIPYLDQVNKKVIKVSLEDFKKGFKEVNLFRENIITQETLRNGLDEVLDSLIISEKVANKKIGHNKEELKPIIELQAGHISQLLASGRYNGIMGDFLVKGGSNKVINSEVEDDENKTTTIKTEIIKPFIEITNKVGDIVYKDF